MHSQSSEKVLRVLWGFDTPSTRGPRPRWSIGDVQASAIALADSEGLAGVTLAKVAASLELTTTAIYRYVDSKEGLENLMADAAVGEPPVLTGETWQERCREWCSELSARYEDHPWMVDLRPAGLPQLPNPLRWIECLMESVAEVPGLDILGLALLLEGIVRSYAAMPRGATVPSGPSAWLVEAMIETCPHLANVSSRDFTDPERERRQAVDLVLRGVAATLEDTQ